MSERNSCFDSEVDDSDKDPDFSEPDDCDGSSSSSDNENLATLRRNLIKKRLDLNSGENKNLAIRKRGRKVVKGDTREFRKRRQILKNTGKQYTTAKGKVVRSRQPKPLERCRKCCKNRIPEEIRTQLFNDFWNIGSYDKRVSYTSSLMLQEEKKNRKDTSQKKSNM